MHSGKLGYVDETRKPLSQLGICEGFTLTHINNTPIVEIASSNVEIRSYLVKNEVHTLCFKAPKQASKWVSFGGEVFYRLFTDGGRRSPHYKFGIAGCGYAIVRGPFHSFRDGMISDTDGVIIARGNAYLGKNGVTNNAAEYIGLALGLKRCLELGINNIQHMCDSQIVVDYATGRSEVHQYKLHDIHTICERLKTVIGSVGGEVIHTHTVREGNREADREANYSMDFLGPCLAGKMADMDPDTFPSLEEIRGWYGSEMLPSVTWSEVGGENADNGGAESDSESESDQPEVEKFATRARPDIANSRMRTEIKTAYEWFTSSVSDDQVAHWDGFVVPFVPLTARAAAASVLKFVLNRLPSRCEDKELDSFSQGNWTQAWKRAPNGSGAGADGTPPDVIKQLVATDPDLAEMLYKYHNYIAHGEEKNRCGAGFLPVLPHDEWARLLYVIPRWLLHCKPAETEEYRLSARNIRDRAVQFFDGDWEALHRMSLNMSTPIPRALLSWAEVEKEAANNAIKLIKNHGEISRAAGTLKNPGFSLTKGSCDRADPDGDFWRAVVRKLEGLHPDPSKKGSLTERSHRQHNGNKEWGCGGLSDRISHIHFAASMSILLKPKGKHKDTVFKRLMENWRSVGEGEWTVRPIAAGNVHDRLINRARLRAFLIEDLQSIFITDNIAQMAFGTKRGTSCAFFMQVIHKQCNPDHDTELCDGENAYNMASRLKIAESIVTSDKPQLRRQYGYFLMGHRLQNKVYARGVDGVLVRSKCGVRQGDPYAGFAYSVGQMNMLKAMKTDVGVAIKDVLITCIVDDIKIQGPPRQCATIHQWLARKGKMWGYKLNTTPGKTVLIPGVNPQPLEPQQNAARRLGRGTKLHDTQTKADAGRKKENSKDANCGIQTTAKLKSGRKSSAPRRFEAICATVHNKVLQRSHSIDSSTPTRTQRVQAKTAGAKLKRSSTMESNPRNTATIQGYGPPNGDWEGYVYYASEDEDIEAGMHRVGTACEFKDGNDRHIAFGEYDSAGNKLNRTILRSYLDRKRQDKRTQPKYVSAEKGIELEYASTSASATYVGLPIGSSNHRQAYLEGKANGVVDAVEKIASLDDSEARYRLLRYCATSWARYPTASMPTCGDGDYAMNTYIRRVDDCIRNATIKLLEQAGNPESYKQFDPCKMAEISLPGRLGGLGIADLRPTVPAAYVSTVIALIPTLKLTAPRLHDYFISELGSDTFHVDYAYKQLLLHHEWHDGSPERGVPPFKMPMSTKKAITTAAASEKSFMLNRESRIAKQVRRALASRAEKGNRKERRVAKQQYARFLSAGGKMAYHWLGLVPRITRLERQPTRFPGHLFKIALQYRCGLACVSPQVEGARCKCKCKKSGSRKTMDTCGTHLSVCPWGGWRIAKHDRVNSVYGEFLREAGNDACWARVDKLTHSLPSHSKHGGRTRVRRIPDIISMDQQGHVSLMDAMITLPTANAKKPLAAARGGEKMKRDKYEQFKAKCEKENPNDPRLNREVTPIVFETYGAAGPTALAHMSLTRHQYGNIVLPCEDNSSESVFYSKWACELSTALQLGNAEAIYNIPRMVRTHARPLGDVETDLPSTPYEATAGASLDTRGHSASSSSDTESDEPESESEE